MLSDSPGVRYAVEMHELSFAQQILESIERETAAYPGCTVAKVKLRAGDMLALEPASLRFALEALAVGTAMEGAAVELQEYPGGKDLIIEEIELNDDEDQA